MKRGELVGGREARLALARAMLREGRLWSLDEPTSSLDYVTGGVFSAFAGASG